MTWEERQTYQDARERLAELRARLDARDPESPVSHSEAIELLELIEVFAERVSPARWDRALEAIAHEAARRADVLAARRN